MNNSIYITQISKSFGDKKLFENISINFHPWEKIWIIWGNGTGKTTLLRILAWEIQPDTWGIGNKNTIGYMKQQIEADENITVFEYLLLYVQSREEYKMYPALEEVWLAYVDMYQTVKSLSWWEQKKLSLAAIILQKADVLLLDEPTNHLDQTSLELLQKIITNHQGIVLFVSHDRHFLNMMCNKIIELDNKKITIYHGNYEWYKEEKQRMYERQIGEYVAYQKQKKKRETWMAEMRQRASIYINPALGRLIKSKEKYIEKEIYAKQVEKVKTDRKLSLHAEWGTHKGKLIFHMNQQNIWFDDTILINEVSIEIRGKDRIIVTWPNGSGKTTLIKYIISAINGKVGTPDNIIWNDITVDYFDQHNEILQSQEIVYERFAKNIKTKTDETGIRSQLAMIWLSPNEIYGSIASLSYGQKVKIKFLQMLSAPIDLLVLDEPTNHLDIPTRETIEDMIQWYWWALIFVSHDQYFADKVETTMMYTIENKTVKKTTMSL